MNFLITEAHTKNSMVTLKLKPKRHTHTERFKKEITQSREEGKKKDIQMSYPQHQMTGW